jgi:pimeloyl-ACP methyl ester carboxylesterase
MRAQSPTIVLVHGAFVDGASWAPVARILLRRGHRVRVPAVPHRGLSADAANLRAFVEQIEGPVILAGHCYGGAVSTVAGAAANVAGLVFVAGCVLDEGESLAQLQEAFPDTDLAAALVCTGRDLSVRIDAFAGLLADGLDPEVAAVLAVSQRPLAASALTEPASVAAWRTTPAWGIVAAADAAVHPDVVRFGLQRAGIRHVVELDAPHLVMLTHPDEVAKVIMDAIAEPVR